MANDPDPFLIKRGKLKLPPANVLKQNVCSPLIQSFSFVIFKPVHEASVFLDF